MALTPFHIAFPVNDLDAARRFYGTVLGCAEGRSTANWIDFDLFGHQIFAHVDGHNVPVPHYGVVLDMPTFHTFADRLKAADVKFEMEPQIRFKGLVGEQATMFLLDPAGNALEFKAFADMSQVFAK
jgi:extradiol dioxygenase family protein